MDLKLALQGNLQAFEDALVKDVRVAMREGLEGVAKAGKAKARAASRALGPVGMAWAYTAYPQGRQALADDPAIVLHPRGEAAEKILRAQAGGETIRTAGALNLWIPVPGSPADRRKPKGQSLVESIMARVGRENIRIIPATGSRPAMAVARDASVTKTGRVGRGGRARTKSGGYRKGTADVPLFYLVPRVRLEPSIDLDRAFRETQDGAAEAISKALARRLGRGS